MNSPVQNKELLLHLLYTHKEKIKAFGVKELGLFGSFKTGTDIHANSDVDVLVEFKQGQKNYDNFIELAFYLEELLGRKVELVTPGSLSKFIGPEILKEVEYINLSI